MNKKEIEKNIKDAFSDFITALQKHDDINRKREDGGWSVGEIANHIVKGTTIPLGRTKKTNRPYDQHENDIRNVFLDFNAKYKAMSLLQPDSKNYIITEIIASLEKNKAGIIKIIRKDDLTETCIDILVPVWGNLTKYEWLVLYESHIKRHTRQVNEFNESFNFK